MRLNTILTSLEIFRLDLQKNNLLTFISQLYYNYLMPQSWEEAQKWESDWWSNCTNTYWEETKQLTYAKKMGLKAEMDKGKYPIYDLKDKSVIDIGGGPVSMLLKCINVRRSLVVDPCNYPKWIEQRYFILNIDYLMIKGEDIKTTMQFDEVWIYNVLQHVDDPKLIIDNAKKVSKIIRIFEWIDMPPVEGHPHELKENILNEWLGGIGKTEQLDENGCRGRAYYGIFPTPLYIP